MCTSGTPLRIASRATSRASRTSSGGSFSRAVNSSSDAAAERSAARSSASLMSAKRSAWRITERAASNATFPPPMTTTLRPSVTRYPKLMFSRNSIARSTPSSCTPSMASSRLLCAPMPRKTAS